MSDLNASCHSELALAALRADIACLRICDISDLISLEIPADINVLKVIVCLARADYEVLHACNFRIDYDVDLLLESYRTLHRRDCRALSH